MPTDPGWEDGVPYQNIQIINNEYYEIDGTVTPYNNWSRTALLPCKGAQQISIYAFNVGISIARYNCFFDENKNYISCFTVSSYPMAYIRINVPSNAAFFGLSGTTAGLKNIVSKDITPYA